MAEHHLSVKKGSRAKGQSAVARAAYRAGEQLIDQRTGLTHDFSRKSGVMHTEILLPSGAPPRLRDRGELWNAAEAAERRKDSAVDREWELGLPAELDDEERLAITRQFGVALTERYGIAVDVAIHRPSRHGDQRNHHAHLKGTTRVVSDAGFGGKTEILDSPRTSAPEIQWAHETACRLINDYLVPKGIAPIDWRRLEVRRDEAIAEGRLDDAIELSRPAQNHVGVSATAMSRKGFDTDRQTARARAQDLAQEARQAAAEYRQLTLEAAATETASAAQAGPPSPLPPPAKPARSPAATAAAQAILARPRPALPPRDPPAIAFSQKGPDGPDQVRRARESLVAKSLKHLRQRLAQWVGRAFDVVAGRAPVPRRIPDGLAREAYEEGLRVGANHRAFLGDRAAAERAAGRIAEHIASSAAPPPQPSGSISRDRFPGRER